MGKPFKQYHEKWRELSLPLGIVSIASLSMIIFINMTPPLLDESIIASIPVLSGMDGDWGVYLWRFLLSFGCLGLLPVITARFLGMSVKNLGIRKPVWQCNPLLFYLAIPVFVLIGCVGAFTADNFHYYPYSHTLVEYIKNGRTVYLFIHILLYVVLYYLPWELFLRGFLILPLLEMVGRSNTELREKERAHHRVEPSFPYPTTAATLIIIAYQVIPSALLHFGHPVTESVGAIAAGLFFGYLVLKTGSILPALFLHALSGVSLDVIIVLRHLRILP